MRIPAVLSEWSKDVREASVHLLCLLPQNVHLFGQGDVVVQVLRLLGPLLTRSASWNDQEVVLLADPFPFEACQCPRPRERHEEELQCQRCLDMTKAAVEVDCLQQFRHLFSLDMWVVPGVVFALFSLLLGCWFLVSLHPPLQDSVVQCLCQDLLHAECLVVTAYVFDKGNQLFDLLSAASVPLQLPKRRLCRNRVARLVLQLTLVVGEGLTTLGTVCCPGTCLWRPEASWRALSHHLPPDLPPDLPLVVLFSVLWRLCLSPCSRF